jgi:hypothetical protein
MPLDPFPLVLLGVLGRSIGGTLLDLGRRQRR